jgi:DNA-binding MarR family transcriptional regulator
MRNVQAKPPASGPAGEEDAGERREAGAGRGRRRFRQAGLTDSDYTALGEFRRAIREFLAFSQEAAREHGLTAQQHQALLVIRAHAGPGLITVGDLAERLMIKSHSAVGLVTRLEERDLVLRKASARDRRVALLELRPRGAEILEAISMRNLGKIGRTAEILEDIVQTARRLDVAGGRSKGAGV